MSSMDSCSTILVMESVASNTRLAAALTFKGFAIAFSGDGGVFGNEIDIDHDTTILLKQDAAAE